MLSNEMIMKGTDFLEKKFSILQEISKVIVATDNISAIANIMLDLSISYTNAEKGSIMLLNERGELYILASRGIDTKFVRDYRVKIGEGIAGFVAMNEEPVIVENIETDERFKDRKRDRYKTHSFISCPIVSKNKLLGVINTNDKKDNTPFTEDEFTLLKIIANQAAITFENAFLMSQLRSKAIELEDVNKKLLESDVIKTEFLTRASHELRTPLNAIKGAIYFLQQPERQVTHEEREFYEIIAKETNKLISIVDNLLDLLRVEDETRIVRKSVIKLSDLFQEIQNLRFLKTPLMRKNIQLRTSIQEGISDIVGDRTRIIQCFVNLLDGLIYFLEMNDSIEISATENDLINLNIVISRRLPDQLLPNLFVSKSILQLGQPEESLKLYLARKVMDVHRWDLRYENKEDNFSLSIAISKSKREKIEAIIDSTMEMFIELTSELLNLNICSIMLKDDLTDELTIRGALGLDDEVMKRTRIRIGDRIAGWVALEGKPLLIENIESDPRFKRTSIPQYNTKSLLSVPLKIDDRVVGVLNLNNKKTQEPFTMVDLTVASVLSERIAHFIEKLYREGYSEDGLKSFLSSFDNLIHAGKRYQKKDIFLPNLVSHLMDELGAEDEEKRVAVYVSLLYDLGLALFDKSITLKKKLTSSDMRTFKSHPHTTVGLLNNFEFSENVKKAILHHHERYDGSGYPDGLKGEEIPLISRVLSVVDAFYSMTAGRPYREALSKDDALKEIKMNYGTIYDPRVVDAFERVYHNLF